MKKKYNRYLFIGILLFASTLCAKTIHVPAEVKTIQAAINSAEPGDTVLVAPGTYKENINFNGKNIMVASHYVVSQNPKFIKNTIIDGGHPDDFDTSSCVLFVSGEGKAAVLQGFTLTNGRGAVRTEPNGTTWREGGGIMIIGSSPTIRNNLILKNRVLDKKGVTSTGGGGISSVEGNPIITNNYIMINEACYAAGIMLFRSGVVLRNNIICQNSGGLDYGGGGVVMEGNGPGPKIMENNTIVANAAFGSGFYGGRAGGLLVFKTSLAAKNNIIWGNIQNNGGQIYIHHELTTADFSYNNIEGGWEGEGNINSLPKFSQKYFLLSKDSPCIDAGCPDSSCHDPASSSHNTMAKNPASGSLRNDMGAYGGPGSAHMTIPDIFLPDAPYSGIPFQIPGGIEAEAFDWGSEGKAYHDNEDMNQGGMYRFSGVDIETCSDFSGGYNISHIHPGEWLNYTVNVIASEKYDLALRFASAKNGGSFHLECESRNLTGTIKVPETGGRQKWQRIIVPDIHLPSGKHVIKLVCESGEFNLNAFRFSFASSTLPAQWVNHDVGDVSETGSAGLYQGIFYIEGSGKASGHVYYNDADEFHFVYTKLSGDMEIIVHLLTHTYTHEWGKTGVMIRENLEDKSKYAMVGVTLAASPVLYKREKTGEPSDLHSWHPRTGYNWLKLVRTSDTFTGYKSEDGKTWIELEENAVIPMTDTVYVGLAITSFNDGIISSASFDNVKVRELR